MKARSFSLWAASFAAWAVIGYNLPPFAVLRKITEHDLPDHKKEPRAAQLYTKLIEKEMLGLSLVKKLSDDPRYEMARAWESTAGTADVDAGKTLKLERSGEVFTADTLQVPGGITARPLVFTDRESKSAIIVVHVGRKVTGFPMIVHGGILATLLDEALGRTAFMSFPAGVGVTANLSLQYKAPSIAHQFLVIRTSTDQVNSSGTKASVSGTVETLKGKLLVKSSAVFVVPKHFQLKRLEGL